MKRNLFRLFMLKFISLFLIPIIGFCNDTSQIPSINDMMSIEDQRKTGVIRLKQNEKMELSKWLVAHGFYDRHENPSETFPLVITRNIGTQMTLSDGSEWQIAPEDVSTAKGWEVATKIE